MMKLKTLFYMLLWRLGIVKPTFYINGAETLPPPLSLSEEQQLLKAGSQKSRDTLIVHNLRLVVYIARKFDSS